MSRSLGPLDFEAYTVLEDLRLTTRWTDGQSRNGSQRHAYDDSEPRGRGPSGPYSPRPASLPLGPEVDATVRWFSADRGFGFVALADGSGDAFLPGRVLSSAGYTTVASGASLRVRLGQGQKGPQVAELLSVDESTAQPEAPRRSGPGAAPRSYGSSSSSRGPAPTGGEDVRGTVKWFNQAKGFGFITPETGGKDVFVHASVLARSGLAELSEGQVVRVRVAQGAKGPEASYVELP